MGKALGIFKGVCNWSARYPASPGLTPSMFSGSPSMFPGKRTSSPRRRRRSTGKPKPLPQVGPATPKNLMANAGRESVTSPRRRRRSARRVPKTARRRSSRACWNARGLLDRLEVNRHANTCLTIHHSQKQYGLTIKGGGRVPET